MFAQAAVGQDVLAEFDVDGGNASNNPADTGNITNVSSVGFTRGSGATYARWSRLSSCRSECSRQCHCYNQQ